MEKGAEHPFAQETLASLRAPGAATPDFDRPVPKEYEWDDPDSPEHTPELRADIEKMARLWRNREASWREEPWPTDYSNVTLHVARTERIGKTAMEELAAPRFVALRADLSRRLSPERRVLFCVHKNVEHLVPTQVDLGVRALASAHWGAVDESNAFKDFDAVVIFGLPFRDHVWGTNVFFALQGVQCDDWHDNPAWKQHANVRELLQRRHLAASIIQALGRVRLRKVTDEHGHCAPTDVFIVLPPPYQRPSAWHSLILSVNVTLRNFTPLTQPSFVAMSKALF